MDMTFDDCFSQREIVHALAVWRTRVLPHRHAASLRNELFSGIESPEEIAPSVVSAFLPGRREWKRPALARRRGRNVGEIATAAIINAVRAREMAGTLCDCEWGRNLLSLCEEIRQRIGNRDFSLSTPVLHLRSKDGGGYRCLASYAEITDRLLLRGTVRYLRDILDAELSPCCHSFRYDRTRNYQTAIAALADYRRRNGCRRLHVAECDIRKFFDVIHHDEVRKALAEFVRRAGEHGRKIDSRACAVVMAYLDSYATFRSFASAKKTEGESREWDNVSLPALEDLRPFHGDFVPEELPIGIPQGGALSPLIANIVLDLADRRVLDGADNELFYARFCDDMVIVHPSRAKCKAAFDRYMEALREMRLPIHPVNEAPVYGREFFETKSKGPFAWDNASVGAVGTAPWVSFLGCQIGFNGDVRIRKETIDRHVAKLKRENGAFVRLLHKAIEGGAATAFRKPHATKTILNACIRHALRLVAKGVGCVGAGRVAPGDREGMPGRRGFCWTAAFPSAAGHSGTLRQMRRLDTLRDHLLHPFLTIYRDRDFKRRFLGRPFSYFGDMAGCAQPALPSPGRNPKLRLAQERRVPPPDDVAYYREIG